MRDSVTINEIEYSYYEPDRLNPLGTVEMEEVGQGKECEGPFSPHLWELDLVEVVQALEQLGALDSDGKLKRYKDGGL